MHVRGAKIVSVRHGVWKTLDLWHRTRERSACVRIILSYNVSRAKLAYDVREKRTDGKRAKERKLGRLPRLLCPSTATLWENERHIILQYFFLSTILFPSDGIVSVAIDNPLLFLIKIMGVPNLTTYYYIDGLLKSMVLVRYYGAVHRDENNDRFV